MARLFTCGFEENNLLATMWSAVSGTPTIQTVRVRSGTYALEFNGVEYVRRFFGAAKITGTCFVRGYYFLEGNPSATIRIFDSGNGADTLGAFAVDILTTGVIRLVNRVTGTTADGGTFPLNQWNRVEVRALLSDTVGELELRVDGVTAASITAEDTLSDNLGRLNWGVISGTLSAGNELFVDDVAINDETGTFQNSWPGAGKIALIEPASDNTMQWEDGATANPSLFSNVDDLPGAPDDATTYNKEDDTASQVDRMNVSTLPVEVPSNADMILLDMYMRVGSTATTARDITNKIWDEVGVLTNGPLISAAVNGWRIASVGPTNQHQVFELGARTKANVEAFDVGYDNNSVQAARERRVTALWVNVEWIEAAGETPVTSDAIIAFESQVGLARDEVASLEALVGLSADEAQNLESAGSLAPEAAVPYESVVSLIQDRVVAIESLATAVQEAAPVFEALQGLMGDAAQPFEAAGSLAPDAVIAFESLTSLLADAATVFEALQGAVREEVLSVESLQGVAPEAASPFEAAGTLAPDRAIPFEAGQAVLQDVVSPIESGGTVSADRVVSLEALGGALADAVQVLEAAGTVAVELAHTYESQGAVSRDETVSLEAMASALQDVVVAVEALGRVLADAVIAYESKGVEPPGVELFIAARQVALSVSESVMAVTSGGARALVKPKA